MALLMTVCTILFVVVCFALCIVILLQAAKGGGLGAGLGGGGTATTQVFGGRGPGGFLARATVVFAASFMILSLVLAHLSSRPQSVFAELQEEETGGLDEDEIIESGTLDELPDGTNGAGGTPDEVTPPEVIPPVVEPVVTPPANDTTATPPANDTTVAPAENNTAPPAEEPAATAAP